MFLSPKMGLPISFCPGLQVHTMMEESATSCVAGDFAQALEKAKEAVSHASRLFGAECFVFSVGLSCWPDCCMKVDMCAEHTIDHSQPDHH